MAVADTSCSVRPEGGKGDDVLETVARIGSKLASEQGGEAAAVVESLRELQGVHMTFEALEATKIGRAVNALRKSAPSEEVRQLAAALYKGWKALANERFRSSRAPPQQPGIEKGPSTPPPPPVNAKQSARPEDELETIAPTSVVVEAAPEAKLHLHEGFDSAAILRKPKSLRVINTNAPGKAEHRRVMVVRRTAAAPEPAPASSTKKRNGGDPNSNNQLAYCPATASHQGTNTAAKRVSPTGGAPSTTANKPPTALPKPTGSSGACKRKAETPAVIFDEVCAAIVKTARSLRMINTNAAGKAEQRCVTVVRHTTAAPETAPASNTKKRNGGDPNSNNQQAYCPATASHQGTKTAAPLTTTKPPTALPKPIGSSGACKRKAEATTVFDEARLARARVRLHEGYKEASAVKEKRKIKQINVIDAMGKKAWERTACHVRRGARLPTGQESKLRCLVRPRCPGLFEQVAANRDSGTFAKLRSFSRFE